MLYRFVVAVRQQGIYVILGLGHGQFHTDFNNRVGQLFQLEIQAAQLARTCCCMDGHGIRGKGDAVVLGDFGGKRRSAAGILHRGRTVQHAFVIVGDGIRTGVLHRNAIRIPVNGRAICLLDGNGNGFQAIRTVEGLRFLRVVRQQIAQFQITGRAAFLYIGQVVRKNIADFDQTADCCFVDYGLAVPQNLDLGIIRAAQRGVDVLFLVGGMDLCIDAQVLVPGTVLIVLARNIPTRVSRVADACLKGQYRQNLLDIRDRCGQVQAGRALHVVLLIICFKVKVLPGRAVPILVLSLPGQVAAVIAAVAVIKGQGAFLQGQVLGQLHIQGKVSLGRAVKHFQVCLCVALHRDPGGDLHGNGALAFVQLVVGLADIALGYIGRFDLDRGVLGSKQHRVAGKVTAVAAAHLVTVAVLGLLVVVGDAAYGRCANIPVDGAVLYAGQGMAYRRVSLLTLALDQALVQQFAALGQHRAVIHQAGPAGIAAGGRCAAVEGPVGGPAAHIHGQGIAAADLADVLGNFHHMANLDRAAGTHAAVADLVQHCHTGVVGFFQFGQGVVVDKALNFFCCLVTANGHFVEAVLVHIGGAAVVTGIRLLFPKRLAVIQPGTACTLPTVVLPTLALASILQDGRILCFGCVQNRQFIVSRQLLGGIPFAVAIVRQADVGNVFQVGRNLFLAHLVDGLFHTIHHVGCGAHGAGVKLHQHIVGGQVVILCLLVDLRIIDELIRVIGRGDFLTAKGQVAGHVHLTGYAGHVGAQLLVLVIVQHGFAIAAQPVVCFGNVAGVAAPAAADVHTQGRAVIIVITVGGFVLGVATQYAFVGIVEVAVDFIGQFGLHTVQICIGDVVHGHVAACHVHIRLQEALITVVLGKIVLIQFQRDEHLQVAGAERIRLVVALADGPHSVAAHLKGQLGLLDRGAIATGKGGIFIGVQGSPCAAAVGLIHIHGDFAVVVGTAVVVLIAPVHVDTGGIIPGIITGVAAAFVGFVGPQQRVDGNRLAAVGTVGIVYCFAVELQAALHVYIKGNIPAGYLDAAQALAGILVAQLQGHTVADHHAVNNVTIGVILPLLVILLLGDLGLGVHIKVADMAQARVVCHVQVIGCLGGDAHDVGIQHNTVIIRVGVGPIQLIAAVIEPCFNGRLYRCAIVHAAYLDGELHRHVHGAEVFLLDHMVLVALQNLAVRLGIVIGVRTLEHLAIARQADLTAFAGDLDAHPQALGSAHQLFIQCLALGIQRDNVVCGAETADQGVILGRIAAGGPLYRGLGADYFRVVVRVRNFQGFIGFNRGILVVVQRVGFVGGYHALHIVGCFFPAHHFSSGNYAVLGIVMVFFAVAGVLLRDRHPINIHIVASDLDVAVLVVVRRQLDVVHVGHGGGQVFAAILAALGSDLIRGVMIILGKGVGVVVVAPDVVFIAVHGCGGDQVHHTVFAGAVNIVAAVIAGSNVAVQAAALEVERTAAMAQAAALGGIVGGDVAAVYGQGTVALAHTAAAFGGFVAGNVTATHQAVAGVYVPAGAIDGLIATDDYILRGIGVAKQQAAAAVLVHAAAAFGTGVAGDAAAGQGHGAARLVDRAIFAGIAADLALGHGKLSAAVVGNVDDTVLGCAVVGDRTAFQRVAALGNVDCTAVAAGAERCILKDAAVGDDRVIGLGKAAVDNIYRAAAARLAAGDGAALAKGEAAAAVHADRTAAVRRTAVGDGGIGHSDVGIVAQQQCAAVGSGAADGAALGGIAVDDIDVALNGQGGFAADARDGMARQIQRDIGVLADLGAGVGIGQQLDSQLLVGILRQHGAGDIHSNLQAVVGAANDLAILYDLRDRGFHLGHAQGQGVSALDGVVVDGFIFQGLAGILVQPAAIVVDGRCLGQVQHGIGLGLVGIHILAQLGAVVFHRAALVHVDDDSAVVCSPIIQRGADTAAFD